MKICKLLLLVLFVASCSNSNSNGVSPKGGGGGNPPDDKNDPQEQSQKILDRYKLESLIPAVGALRTYETKQTFTIRSGKEECSYIVLESEELLEKGADIVSRISYKQNRIRENHVDCPLENVFLVDHPREFELNDYVRNRQSSFVSWADPDLFLFVQGPKYKSAELISMKNEKWKDLNATKIRLKVKDQAGDLFYADSVFANDNSFLGLLDSKIIRVSNNETVYYKTTVHVQ